MTAMIHERLGHPELAQEFLDKAKARPDWAVLERDFHGLAESFIRIRRGEMDEARRLYERARNHPRPDAFGDSKYVALQRWIEERLGP